MLSKRTRGTEHNRNDDDNNDGNNNNNNNNNNNPKVKTYTETEIMAAKDQTL
jgi:hypothetical protein